jgi:putative endonuclease
MGQWVKGEKESKAKWNKWHRPLACGGVCFRLRLPFTNGEVERVMKDARRQLGDQGENLAAAALRQQGYKILARNYVTPLGEIDLIVQKGRTVVVVEVKTRKSLRFGSPQESVSHAKQNRLRRLADYYIKDKRLTGALVRFDVVAVTLAGDEPQVEIIQNAF